MSRQSKPWYNRQRRCWMVYWGRQKVRLIDGEQNRATRKLAEQRLTELRYEALHNPPRESPVQTVASVLEAYQESARKRLAPSTVEFSFPYLQSFAEAHGRCAADAVTIDHLERWLDEHPNWVSDWTKSFAVRQVKGAFSWAAKKARLILVNPFAGYSTPNGEPRREMTAKEFQDILRGTRNERYKTRPTPSARFRQVCMFLWYTGCRPGEAAKLQWSNVDFETNVIVLKEHKTARRQRARKPRVIPLHPVIIKLLRWLQRQAEPGEFVFQTHQKTPWTNRTLNTRLRRARTIAKVPNDATLYGIRHAFGTRAIVNGGVDLKTVAVLMGHTTRRMTEHYLHLAGQHGHLAAAMLRVNARR